MYFLHTAFSNKTLVLRRSRRKLCIYFSASRIAGHDEAVTSVSGNGVHRVFPTADGDGSGLPFPCGNIVDPAFPSVAGGIGILNGQGSFRSIGANSIQILLQAEVIFCHIGGVLIPYVTVHSPGAITAHLGDGGLQGRIAKNETKFMGVLF